MGWASDLRHGGTPGFYRNEDNEKPFIAKPEKEWLHEFAIARQELKAAQIRVNELSAICKVLKINVTDEA